MNKSPFESQNEQISSYIENEIGTLVDEKVMVLSKANSQVDREEIRQQCYRQAYEHLQQSIEEAIQICEAFYQQLSIDNPHFEKELTAKFSSKIPDQNNVSAFIAGFDPEAVKLSKEESNAIAELGMQWFNEREWAKALIYFSFLCCMEPNNPVRFVLKGMALHNLKQYDEALRAYITATFLAPEYLFAHIQLMKTLIVYQKWSVLKQYYDSFLQDIDSKVYENDQFVVSELKKIELIMLKHKT